MIPLVMSLALGQVVQADRPTVPSAGLAAEGGPGMAWVNPAHLAYDRDVRWGILLGQDLGTARSTFAVTAGTGTFASGVRNHVRPDGVGDWAIDSAIGIPLPQRLAIGVRGDWHLVSGGGNFVSVDVGAAWRPLPWFGVGAVARNVGNPDESVEASTGIGFALRPFDDTLVLGGDWMRTTPTAGATRTLWTASARLRPTEGLFVRGHVDSALRVGAGLEVYFGGVGAGGHALVHEGGQGLTTWIGTDEPGETLVRSGRRVPALDLRELPAYEPRGGLLTRPGPSWLDVLEWLRKVEEDRGVKGVVVTLGASRGSWARLREVRSRIESIVASGRKVTVYLDGSASNGTLYVASAASTVILHPAADVNLIGVSTEIVNAREALDKIGVVPQYAKRDVYKSAPETFTEAAPTEWELEQTGALLDDIDAELVREIAAGRGRTAEEVRAWIDGGPYTARQALALGLVDQLLYPDEVDGWLERHHGGPVRITRLGEAARPQSAWVAPAQIVVVYVTGAIVDGASSPGGLFSARTSGSETVVRQLRRAAGDPAVRAVVLRVDSPGGSAFASDEIWRAVEKVKETGKPVVVSMGGAAASGGYWVSANADAIWAEPTTVTGSIGVFSGKFDVSPVLGKLGVHTTTLSRGTAASLWSPTRSWDAVEAGRAQAMVDDVYDQFLAKVADGRGLEVAAVDAVARGRVWSGSRAVEHGLVDHLGGLQEAIADARARAGIRPGKRVSLVTYPAEGLGIPALLGGVRTAEVPPSIEEALAPLRTWLALDGQGVLAVEPVAIEPDAP